MKLPIIAELRATDDAIYSKGCRGPCAEKPEEVRRRRIVRRVRDVTITPTAADVGSDVKTSPAINCWGWWRVGRRLARQVSRRCDLRQPLQKMRQRLLQSTGGALVAPNVKEQKAK